VSNVFSKRLPRLPRLEIFPTGLRSIRRGSPTRCSGCPARPCVRAGAAAARDQSAVLFAGGRGGHGGPWRWMWACRARTTAGIWNCQHLRKPVGLLARSHHCGTTDGEWTTTAARQHTRARGQPLARPPRRHAPSAASPGPACWCTCFRDHRPDRITAFRIVQEPPSSGARHPRRRPSPSARPRPARSSPNSWPRRAARRRPSRGRQGRLPRRARRLQQVGTSAATTSPCADNGGLAPVMMRRRSATADNDLAELTTQNPQAPSSHDDKVCQPNPCRSRGWSGR